MVTHKCCVTKIVAYLMSINDEVIVIVKYIVTKGAKMLSLIKDDSDQYVSFLSRNLGHNMFYCCQEVEVYQYVFNTIQ